MKLIKELNININIYEFALLCNQIKVSYIISVHVFTYEIFFHFIDDITIIYCVYRIQYVAGKVLILQEMN